MPVYVHYQPTHTIWHICNYSNLDLGHDDVIPVWQDASDSVLQAFRLWNQTNINHLQPHTNAINITVLRCFTCQMCFASQSVKETQETNQLYITRN